jgi:glucose-1-phosphate thymidylyltransferase
MTLRALVPAGVAPAVGRMAPDGLRAGPLLPVANAPILAHVLGALARAGVTQVVVPASPALAAPVTKLVAAGVPWGLEVDVVPAGPDGSLAQALAAAAPILAGAPFVLHPGDGLLHHDLAGLVARLAMEGPDVLLLAHRGALGGRRQLALASAGAVTAGPGLHLADAALFGAGALARAGAREALAALAPGAGVGAVGGALRTAGGRVEVHPVAGWQRYDGDLHTLLAMNRSVLDAQPGDEAAAACAAADCEVQGRVRIHPTAHVESTVVRGPAVIGARARVLDAYVGPYTAIGDGVRVEGAEIEHSILLAGASVLHIGGRLEASVVGRDARVLRDFALPRAVRLHLGDGAEVALR